MRYRRAIHSLTHKEIALILFVGVIGSRCPCRIYEIADRKLRPVMKIVSCDTRRQKFLKRRDLEGSVITV